MSPGWIAICRFEEVPRLGARRVTTPWGTIAVFRTRDDRLYAIEDRCPHKGGPLSQGIVHDNAVACPLHGWVIDLESASAREPDKGCIRRFDVRLKDGAIELMPPMLQELAAE